MLQIHSLGNFRKLTITLQFATMSSKRSVSGNIEFVAAYTFDAPNEQISEKSKYFDCIYVVAI